MKNNDITLIVSGSIRSGTSVMMRTLKEAGISAFYDNNKSPDENNPNGYFESARIYELRRRNFANIKSDIDFQTSHAFPLLWLNDIIGGVVKVLPNELLENLPLDRKYAVIFMRRDHEEVAQSYWKMLSSDTSKGRKLIGNLSKEEFVEKWKKLLYIKAESVFEFMKKRQENFTVLEVEMHKLNEQIDGVSQFVSQQLGREINLIVPPKDY